MDAITISISGSDVKSLKQDIPPGIYTIGVSDDCDISLPDSNRHISPYHAELDFSSTDGVVVQDLDSNSGTMVNGSVIYKARINHGDIITIANVIIKIEFPQVEKEKKKQQVLTVDEGERQSHEIFENSIVEIQSVTQQIMHEVGKRIVGQDAVLKAIWVTILCRSHSLLIGVPGLAKTYMANTFSEVLGLNFNRIQFTPDLMPTDIVGAHVIQEDENNRRYFEFEQGPVFTQLLLADEINRTPPKTQAALLEAMQEGQVTVGKKTLSLPEPFCVIATQNPLEQEGTYPLPEAQQDRFLKCIILDYPDLEQEKNILIQTCYKQRVNVKTVINTEIILRFQKSVDLVAIPDEMVDFTVAIVRATRPTDATSPDFVKELIDYGAGPRAGQAILNSAKAYAAIDGRPAVNRDDILQTVHGCLRHRISCSYRARAAKLTEDDLINKILEHVG